MKAIIKGFDYRFKDTRDAYLLITVDKRCLADMPDIKKPMEITIKAKRKQRSLSANAYCWVLCGKVAAKIGNGMRSVDVYRTAIQRAADDTMWIPARVPRGRAGELKERWEHNGEGWLAIPLNSGYEPYTEFRLFQGSSTYDTRQMGRLIDELISEAENLGIDALTPGEKARMMSEWET